MKCAKNTLNALAIPSDSIQSEFCTVRFSIVFMTDVYTSQSNKFTAGKVDVPQLCVESRFMDVHFGFMLVHKSQRYIWYTFVQCYHFRIRVVKNSQASSFKI